MLADSAHAFAGTKRFVIEREIGHGGMGVVYQARDLERNTRVALKALTQKDALNIYRLKNEFRQLADLSHPNLVTLHELCNEGNSWFFTMELVQGRTFDEYVADDRPPSIPPDRTRVETVAGRHLREASITLSQRAISSEFPMPRVTSNIKRLRHALRQLVEAVAALHEAGKLHRDIKPSNVLVTPEGRVVVLDFGLVSNSTFVDPEAQEAERTVGGCVFGTPAYMSPEQAAGEAVTPASDWYAVGTMLYEALTGQLPFDGSVLEILRHKEEHEPPAPCELAHGVPDDLDQLCRDLLRRDPERRPSGPEILRYLVGQSAPRRAFDAQSTVVARLHGELFVGRERHLLELRNAFETTRSGKPVTVLVHGVSGIGKSALVRCFANELIRADEAVVLRGRCYERETVPYKAFDNIIDALSRYMMRLPAEEAAELLPRNVHSLALLFPVLRRVKAIAQARRPKHQTADARELRNQAFGALKDLLLRITDYHPLVINIDDLQWADMDSARLLTFLIGPPDPPPMLLVGTYRRDEAINSAFLQHIANDRTLTEGGAELRDLAVDALDEGEATQLASALLRDVPDATALFSSAIAAEAEGVPFFITELVQHLRGRDERDALALSAQSLSLDQVILERIAGMPEDARKLLRVLSVAAGPLEQGVAIDAAGLPRGDRGALLALRAARLIRTRGTRQEDMAETYHDRVREAVVASLPVEAVREVHATIAHALERCDLADPERLVVHYCGAGDGVRAGETAVEAAHRAARKLAFNRAAELFERAIALLTGNGAAARGLYRHLGDARANAGRGAQAAEAYLKAAEGLPPAEARKLQRLAAQQYLRSGRINEGTALAQGLFRKAGLDYPNSAFGAIAQLLWHRGRLALRGTQFTRRRQNEVPSELMERVDTVGAVYQELSAFDPIMGALLHAHFLRDALRAGEPLRVLQGLSWEVFHLSVLGGHSNEQRALQVLRVLDTLATELGTPYAAATRDMARAAFGLFSGRYPAALEPARNAERVFREQCAGATFESGWVTMLKYSTLEFTGNLSEMTQEAPQRAREAAERDDHFTIGVLMMSVANSHLAAGDATLAMDFLDKQREKLGSGSTTFHHLLVHRTADTLLYQGKGTQALQYAMDEWPHIKRSGLYRGRFMQAVCHYMRARCAFAALTETQDRALISLVEQDLKLVAKLKCFSGLPSCLRAALVHWQGQSDVARELMLEGLNALKRDQLDRYAMCAARRLGELTREEQGSELIAEADAALRSQGITSPERWTALHLGEFLQP